MRSKKGREGVNRGVWMLKGKVFLTLLMCFFLSAINAKGKPANALGGILTKVDGSALHRLLNPQWWQVCFPFIPIIIAKHFLASAVDVKAALAPPALIV